MSSISITQQSAIDYSPEAVINRLKIYIRGTDASAIFCELKGNRAAVTLHVFNEIFSELFEILHFTPSHEMFSDSRWTPVGYVSSILSIFIKFGVDITKAEAFNNNVIWDIVINKLKSFHRPLLAFLILLQNSKEDFTLIDEICRTKSINFYAVNNAILMLTNIETKLEILKIIYKWFSLKLLESYKIPQRLFRDSPDIPICQYIVRHGYNPQAHEPAFNRCRLHRDDPKWDYFAEIYGYRAVHSFLDSDWYLKPGNSAAPKTILPFVLYPLKEANHPRWTLYALAYGEELVQNYKLRTSEFLK